MSIDIRKTFDDNRKRVFAVALSDPAGRVVEYREFDTWADAMMYIETIKWLIK